MNDLKSINLPTIYKANIKTQIPSVHSVKEVLDTHVELEDGTILELAYAFTRLYECYDYMIAKKVDLLAKAQNAVATLRKKDVSDNVLFEAIDKMQAINEELSQLKHQKKLRTVKDLRK